MEVHPSLIPFIAVGCLYELTWLFRFLFFLRRQCFRCQQNLFARYGKENSWALVTGGSDGIGFEFCRQLAQQGFNICMVSRNDGKMQAQLQRIKGECQHQISTMSIVADFGKMTKVGEYEKLISERVFDMDIGVIICNAGYNIKGSLKDIKPSELEDITNVNCLQNLYLAKALLENIRARSKRTGFIFVGSSLGTFPCPGAVSYSASKAFASFVGQGLAWELEEHCDVLVYEPAVVASNFRRDKSQSFFVIGPEKAAQTALRDLGKELVTSGAFSHELQQWLLGVAPLSIIQKKMYQKNCGVLDETRQWAEEQRNRVYPFTS